MKEIMKKVIPCILSILLAMVMTCNVCAAPSITVTTPEKVELISGNLKEGETLIIQDADPDAYENKKVADVVKKANDENTVVTVKEILTELDVDTTEEIKTEDGQTVNPTLFEQLTPFVDLAIQSGDVVKYETEGEVKAKVTIEAAKGMNPEDVLLMQIDPVTGKVYFIVPENIDPETGEIIATFPTLGPVALIGPVDIVSKETAAEEYESQTVAETVTKLGEQNKDIELRDVLAMMGEDSKLAKLPGNVIPILAPALLVESSALIAKASGEDTKSMLQITEDVTVNVDEYSSCTGFADLAIKFGEDRYLYDMSGKFEAEVNRDITQADWKRIVRSAYPDFDVEKAEEDPGILTELEPFTLEDSFVLQLDPFSGEMKYVYEPEVFFEYPGTTRQIEHIKESSFYTWSVNQEDRAEEEVPNLVIRGEYSCMGPFAIFMPKEEAETTVVNPSGFPIWIWILLLLILLAVILIVWYLRKQKKEQNRI